MKKALVTALIAGSIFTLVFWYKRINQRAQTDLPTVLVVGTSADFPPFAFRDKENNITGFDIEIVKEVAKRINHPITIEDMRFDLLLPELQLGRIQIIAAGMTPTPERAKNVLFTKPYLSESPLVIVSLAKKPITSLDELNNKEVIVNTGYTADTYISKFPNVTITRLATIAEAFSALENGNADAFITAAQTLKPVFKELKQDKFHLFTIQGTDETNALALSKHSEYLLPKIQEALDSMQSDGTIDALKKQWGIS